MNDYILKLTGECVPIGFDTVDLVGLGGVGICKLKLLTVHMFWR